MDIEKEKENAEGQFAPLSMENEKENAEGQFTLLESEKVALKKSLDIKP